MINLSPASFKTLVVALAEFGFSGFRVSEIAGVLDCHPKTVKRRIKPLRKSGYIFQDEGRYFIHRDADFSLLDKSVDTSVDKSVHRSPPHESRGRAYSDGTEDKSVDTSVDKSVDPKKGSLEKKQKSPQTPKKEKTHNPPKNPLKSPSKEGDKNPPQDFAGLDLDDFIEQVLTVYGFDANFSTVSKITTRLLSSELNPNQYQDYLTNQLQNLDGRVEEGELSRKKAQRYICSTKSIQWYLDDLDAGDSSGTGKDENAYLNVGKNTYETEQTEQTDNPPDNQLPEWNIHELKHQREEARDAGFDPDNFDHLDPEEHGFSASMLENINPIPPE